MLEEANKRNITIWLEPFVGGANMIDKVPNTFKRIGVDYNAHTIEALIAIRDLVNELPLGISEVNYKSLKSTPPNPITSWLRFVASFGGKFENGYAREDNSDETTFVSYGKRNAQKQSPLLKGVRLINKSYTEIENIKNAVVYCDPPYEGTTGYKTGAFNHVEFWQWCRETAKDNLVFISEYKAPDDFECIWEGVQSTNFASQRTKATHKATEKLFTYKHT
jgi:DNA adenine methylase